MRITPVTPAAVLTLTSSTLFAQDLVLRLTHDDADGVIEVGQTVTYTLTAEHDPFKDDGSAWILDTLNLNIESAPANRVVTSQIDPNDGGSSNGGTRTVEGGIADFTFYTQNGFEWSTPTLRDNPLTVGTFQVTPTCAGPIRFQVRPETSSRGDEYPIANFWINAFNGSVVRIEDTRVEVQSLSAVGSPSGPPELRVAPGEFDGGTDGIGALATLLNGDIVVGGTFDSIGGVPASNIALWDGSAWNAMSEGLNGNVEHLEISGDGTLFASGVFTASGESPAAGLARWNGTGWDDMRGSLTGRIEQIAVSPSGELGAVTREQVLVNGTPRDRWQISVNVGGAWMPTYETLLTSPPRALAYLPDGQLVSCGKYVITAFSSVQAVLTWNGAAWGPLGTLQPLTGAPIELLPDGQGGLLATNGLTLWRWDTSGWAQLAQSDQQIRAVLPLPDGRIVIGGEFSSLNGVETANLAVLDGDEVQPSQRPMDGTVRRLGIDVSGGALLVGDFTVPGSPYEHRGIGRLTSIDQPTFCCLAVDYNANGNVETDDLFSFVQRFLAQDSSADLNEDGVIDMGDIGILLQIYTGGCG